MVKHIWLSNVPGTLVLALVLLVNVTGTLVSRPVKMATYHILCLENHHTQPAEFSQSSQFSRFMGGLGPGLNFLLSTKALMGPKAEG